MQLHLKRIPLRNHAKKFTLFGRVNKTTITRVFSKDLCEIGVTNRANLTRDINQIKHFFGEKSCKKKAMQQVNWVIRMWLVDVPNDQ